MGMLIKRQPKSMQQIAFLIMALFTYVHAIRNDIGGNKHNNNNNKNNNQNQLQQQDYFYNRRKIRRRRIRRRKVDAYFRNSTIQKHCHTTYAATCYAYSINVQPTFNAPLNEQHQQEQQKYEYLKVEPQQQQGQQNQQKTFVPSEPFNEAEMRQTITTTTTTTTATAESTNTHFDNGSSELQRVVGSSQLQDMQNTNSGMSRQSFASSPSSSLSSLSTSNAFRPAQVIDFTLNDATRIEQLTSNYVAYTPHNTVKQFKFPNEYNNNNNYKQNLNGYEPILSYKDPYTYENYQTITGGQHQQQQQQQQQQQNQQEYIVGSSLYVGNSADNDLHNNNNHNNNNLPLNYNNNNNKNNYYYRPTSVEQNFVGGKLQQRLSYDSHDYPPPSYAQSQPQKELDRPLYEYNGAIQPPRKVSTSNYANNFGNYLQAGGAAGTTDNDYYVNHLQVTGNIARPQGPSGFLPTPLPPLAPTQPAYSSYEPFKQPHYLNNKYQYEQIPHPTPGSTSLLIRPPLRRPVVPAPPPTHGLPSFFSFLANTQEYAPHFTNLLLNGVGGGTTSNNQPPALSGTAAQNRRPLRNMQLIKALQNIARNDDLQCVPKVLCQMIATQTQRGELPTFITSPTITK